MYQDAITSFGIPALSDRFDMLRQLGNLLCVASGSDPRCLSLTLLIPSIVQPAVLKSYMRESHLSKIEERLLRPYLLRRADYSTHVRDLNDAGNANVTSTPGSTTTPASGQEVGFNGVTQGAVFGGAGISEAEKGVRLKSALAELERWSKEEDGMANTKTMETMKAAE